MSDVNSSDATSKNELEYSSIGSITSEKGKNQEDLKYSLKETEDVKGLIQENEKLKETVETLRQELVLTNGEMLKKNEIRNLAQKMLRDNNSTFSQEVLEGI